MALYSHNNQTIDYQITPSVLPHDVLLLQGSRFDVVFWQPVLQQLQGQTGRFVTCKAIPDTEALLGLLKALGAEDFRIVAIGDAVATATEMQKQSSHVENTLLYAGNPPRTEELVQAIREL